MRSGPSSTAECWYYVNVQVQGKQEITRMVIGDKEEGLVKGRAEGQSYSKVLMIVGEVS